MLKAHDVFDLTLREWTASHTRRYSQCRNFFPHINAPMRRSDFRIQAKICGRRQSSASERYNKATAGILCSAEEFIQNNPSTVSGIELELVGVNPQQVVAKSSGSQKRRVQRLAPEFAQTKYLPRRQIRIWMVAHRFLGLAPGEYGSAP